MMAGYFAGLAAAALAEAELRLKAEESERQRTVQQELFDQALHQHEQVHGIVIDVDACEVPDLPALPAP